MITNEEICDLAHELWAMAQRTPGEGVREAVARIETRLLQFLQGQEVVGWATHEPTPMLFHSYEEAACYCDDDEYPRALIEFGGAG